MKLTKKDFTDANIAKTEAKITKALIGTYRVRPSLRDEYQPQMITALVRLMFEGQPIARKMHLGCGGGKSLIGIAGMCIGIEQGLLKKIVVTAPTIALCLQLQKEFEATWPKLGYQSKQVRCYNVSSYNEPKNKNETAEEAEERLSEEADDVEPESMVGITTVFSEKEILERINLDEVSIFFVCKPSFFNKFKPAAMKAEIPIDFTWHDEYHNLISQDTRNTMRRTLEEYADVSTVNLFSSASKKSGPLVSWRSKVFGGKEGFIFRPVVSGELVKWGYLKPNLRIFVITAKDVSLNSLPIEQRQRVRKALKMKQNQMKAHDIHDMTGFQYEAIATLKTYEWMNTKFEQPQMITFSSRVAFINEMYGNAEYIQLYNDVASATVERLTSQMSNKECQIAFERFKSAPAASVLMQHSKVAEGADIPALNTAIICRGMNEIALQQALGRIQRKSNNSDTAYLWLFVDNSNDMSAKLAKLASLIHNTCSEFDVQVELINEKKSNGDDDDTGCNDLKEVMALQWDSTRTVDATFDEYDYATYLNAEIKRIAIEQVNAEVEAERTERYGELIDGYDVTGMWKALAGLD